MSEDLYGMELDRRLAAEQVLSAALEVVEAYESCGPKRQCTRDVLAAVRAALDGLRPASDARSVEMAREAYLAERRAEEAEFHVEQLRDARDGAERRIERTERLIEAWELDAPDHTNPVFIGRLREALRRDPCEHEWLDRPESDTRECLICGVEVAG